MSSLMEHATWSPAGRPQAKEPRPTSAWREERMAHPGTRTKGSLGDPRAVKVLEQFSQFHRHMAAGAAELAAPLLSRKPPYRFKSADEFELAFAALTKEVSELKKRVERTEVDRRRKDIVAHDLALSLAKLGEKVYVEGAGGETFVFMIGNGANLDRDVAAFKARNRLDRATGVFVDLSIVYSQPTIPDTWIPVTDGARVFEATPGR